MPNFPGPYEIEFTLQTSTTPIREHVIRVNVAAVGTPAPGALPTAITLQKMGGGTGTLQACADQLWSFLRLNYAASVSCIGFQFWKYISGTFAKDFISAGAVASPAGATGTMVAAQQLTLSFRSANGGIMKLALLEPNVSGSSQNVLVPNAAGTSVQRLAAYIMSADNVAMARDDAFPVAALRDSRGENERIWRDINRP